MKSSSNLSPDQLTLRIACSTKVTLICEEDATPLMRDGAKAIFTREHDDPYALRDRVNKELDSLEADGIISSVPASDCGSPLVVIPKPNSGVRLCVDSKCGVNERLIQSNHPVRRIDDVLHSLRNSRYFCKLDLFKAYLHLKVDEDSSMIQTISTHRGTYRMHRLSFGIKTAPSEFNRILSQILKGLPKTESYFDDIIIHGETLQECTENLEACLQRLSDYDLHINKQNDRVLVPFDPSLPIVLTTDASPTGIAAVLSHSKQGVERPIAYASRSLTNSEQNYSQLDREALAVIFGVTQFFNYLFGKHFKLITDNEQLTRIFHSHKALPRMTSRLLRYASYLSSFDYSVQFKKGTKNENVDCLSRAPIQKPENSVDKFIEEEANQRCAENIFQISSEKITSLTIQSETKKDPELSEIIERLNNNSEDSEFTSFDGILFRRERVVIPKSLRSNILKELHETHLGITKMKQLARQYVYWPAVDRDIENLVKGCDGCALTKSNPPKVSVHPWESPADNWDRIHIDYAVQMGGSRSH
nr:uncharacterized protein K02A2.6-like [Parasteatoda tepidariorum]